MAMKSRKKGNNVGRRMPSVLRDNKGIEARVLIYVLAAVILVLSIGIATSAISGTGEIVESANALARGWMKEFNTDADGNPIVTPITTTSIE